MIFCRVILGRVISKIISYFFPVDMKLILSLSIKNSIKLHVHGFGYALDDGVGDCAKDKLVVELNWCWSFFMDHFM